MMKNLTVNIILMLLSLAVFGGAANADIAIIVHPSNTAEISEKSIENLFLGKSRTFSNGSSAIPLTLDVKSKLMNEFCEKFLDKTNNQFRSYWARLMFSGAGVAPKTIDSEEEMLELVAANPNVIGFVDVASTEDEDVKVIMTKP